MVPGLKNTSLAGQDEWPKNVTEAYNYLFKWEGDDIGGAKTRDYEGVAFGIDGETAKPSGPQPWHTKMTCRNCNRKGHIAFWCENAKAADTNVQDGEVLEDATQQLLDSLLEETETNSEADIFVCETDENRNASFHLRDGINGRRILKNWVLLDSQSTTDAYSNPDLLNVSKTRSIKFDSANRNQFEVTKNNGTKRIFKQSEHGPARQWTDRCTGIQRGLIQQPSSILHS